MAKRSIKRNSRAVALLACIALAIALLPATASAAGEGPDGFGGQAPDAQAVGGIKYDLDETNRTAEAAGYEGSPVSLAIAGKVTVGGPEYGMTDIKKASELKVTAVGSVNTYDGNPHGLGDYTANITAGTTFDFSTDGGMSWTSTPPTRTEAGTDTVIVRANNPNYESSSVTVQLKIDRKAVTVAAGDASKNYGDADPEFSATVTGLVGADTLEYTVTRLGVGGDEGRGTYPDAIVAAGETRQGSYKVTYVPADFTINPAAPFSLTVTGYDGAFDTNAHPVVAVPSVTDGTTVEYSTDGGVTWNTTVPSITNVGSVNVQVQATNPNYGTSTGSAVLRINPAAVVVSAVPASKAAGETDPTYTAIVSGVLDGASISYAVNRADIGDESVGTHTGVIVPVGLTVQGNYSVTYVPADLTVLPAGTMVLNVAGYNGVYDGSEHPLTVSTNVTAGTTIEYSVDGDPWTTTPPSITNVGTMNVRIRATNPNQATITATATLNIDPAPIRVIAGDAQKVYGEAEPGYSASIDGLIDAGDVSSISYTISRTDASSNVDVGRYPGTVVPSGKAVQGNYRITYVSADFSIAKATGLSVVGTGYNGVYDGAGHSVLAQASISGGAPAPAGTVIRYSTDGGTTWTVVKPSVTDIGSKTVKIRAESKNFVAAETTANLAVSARPITVTADNAFKNYQEDDPLFKATVEDLVGGDTEDDLVFAVARPGAGTDENAGSYPNALVPSGVTTQGNYAITYMSGTFTIEPAEATVTTGSATKTYDGKALTNAEASITGLVGGETATVTATGSQAEVGSSPNTYSIKWGTADPKNYTVTERLGTLTVEAAPAGKGTLTFDLAGGTLDGKTGSITMEANVGDTIKLPGAPTKDGYAFKFWKGSEYAAGAEYKVEGDHAFTAEWVKDGPAPVVKHTVAFDANGHGKAPGAQTVEHGKKAKRPANPTASGYTFGGWYKDKACKEAYDFSTPVTSDITLYAKWTKKSSSGTTGKSPKTGDPLAGAFAIALALAAASALALAFSRRRRRG